MKIVSWNVNGIVACRRLPPCRCAELRCRRQEESKSYQPYICSAPAYSSGYTPVLQKPHHRPASGWDTQPDVMCCQEIKTRCVLRTPGYHQFWNPAKRPGYSGTLTLTKLLPLSCSLGMGIEKFDDEGRLITLEYKNFFVVNVYVPSIHTGSKPERPDFRFEWDDDNPVCAVRSGF